MLHPELQMTENIVPSVLNAAVAGSQSLSVTNPMLQLCKGSGGISDQDDRHDKATGMGLFLAVGLPRHPSDSLQSLQMQ